MKVTHFSTSRRGGAAIAACRIAEAQKSIGLDAIVQFRGLPNPGVDHTSGGESFPIPMAHAVLSRAITVGNSALMRSPSILFTPLGISVSKRRLQRDAIRADLFNVHNLYNFFSLRRLARAFPNTPLVATLHDERPLTSGCHYTLGCHQFQDACSHCPQSHLPPIIPRAQTQQRTRATYSSAKAMFVAPSYWIRQQALAFGLPPEQVVHIPNPINTDIFHEGWLNTGTGDCFTVAWLPGKEEEVFWSSVRLLQKELVERGSDVRVRVSTIKEASCPADIHVTRVSGLFSEEERAEFWGSADVAVSITSADNFPNVALEAIACATPLIISSVGGAAEAVKATGGGIVLPSNDPVALSTALIELCASRDAWRARAHDAATTCRSLFNFTAVGKAYRDLYEGMIGDN